MRTYGDHNGTSGITAFDFGTDCFGEEYIDIEYASGGVYTYLKKNVGEVNFLNMKVLALEGEGLNSFINKNVRGRGTRQVAEVKPVPAELVTITLMTTSAVAVELLSEVLKKTDVNYKVS